MCDYKAAHFCAKITADKSVRQLYLHIANYKSDSRTRTPPPMSREDT